MPAISVSAITLGNTSARTVTPMLSASFPLKSLTNGHSKSAYVCVCVCVCVEACEC